MDKTKLSNPTYAALSRDEQVKLLRQIAEHTGTTLIETQEFSRFGRSTFTGIFRHPRSLDSEFVFVPGAEVNLGWDGFTEEPREEMWLDFARDNGAGTDEEIRAAAASPEFRTKITELLRTHTTAMEHCTIAPMLVERAARVPCWREATAEEVANDPEIQELIAEAEKMGVVSGELDETVLITRDDESAPWRVELFVELYYDELQEAAESDGFSLLTLREWEYLAGGGCRTLAPWSESLDFESITGIRPDGENYPSSAFLSTVEETLIKPNFFGLEIAYNPYRYELVSDGIDVARKGGDGGTGYCGDAGVAWSFFPVTPYFVDYTHEKGSEENDFVTSYDTYRRILRLA